MPAVCSSISPACFMSHIVLRTSPASNRSARAFTISNPHSASSASSERMAAAISTRREYMTDFVLDKTENPHPKLLEGAIQARRTARAIGGAEGVYYWAGVLDAMCWATGETHEAMNAWIDSHTGEQSFDGSATRVELRGRKRNR